MHRRDFLGFLAQATTLPAAAWVLGADRVLELPSQRMPLLYTPVAGSYHYQSNEFLRALRNHAPVALLREPLNLHDPLAIALFVGADKIGYVPRRCNRAVAELMNRGHSVHAEVEGLHDDPQDWHGPVHIALWLQGLAPPSRSAPIGG